MTRIKQIDFTKMVASGNDFVVLDQRPRLRQDFGGQAPAKDQRQLKDFAKEICDRKFGVGADGLLLLERSKLTDIRMRIFNADGSEAQMCGNGARCVAYWLTENRQPKTAKLTIETKAGIIEAEVKSDSVKIKLTEPKDMKLGIPVMVNDRALKVNFINTGVPHAVIFVEGLKQIDVAGLGSAIRRHNHFQPAGTNVDFVEIVKDNFINVRTYERGVEAETLACGTGSVAAALVTAYTLQLTNYSSKMNVFTKGGETLKVYFSKTEDKFSDVWLEGKAKIVYSGRIATANYADRDRR